MCSNSKSRSADHCRRPAGRHQSFEEQSILLHSAKLHCLVLFDWVWSREEQLQKQAWKQLEQSRFGTANPLFTFQSRRPPTVRCNSALETQFSQKPTQIPSVLVRRAQTEQQHQANHSHLNRNLRIQVEHARACRAPTQVHNYIPPCIERFHGKRRSRDSFALLLLAGGTHSLLELLLGGWVEAFGRWRKGRRTEW